jgi:cysteinyl-tRNA synthetase
MQAYFKFDLNFVMNITDVDDKIILAARQQHLLEQWLSKHSEVNNDVRETTKNAFEAYRRKNLPLLGDEAEFEISKYASESEQAYGHVLRGKSIANDETPPGDKEAKVKMHLNTTRAAAEALQMSNPSLQQFSTKASGVLLPYIDARDSHTVQGSDHDIFFKLPKQFENRFFEDMEALNVLYPDKLTRVTEYGPEIVKFVKVIQDNGFAYEHEGSLYYDTTAWEKSGGVYARLQPWNRNDQELQADGEGSLSTKQTSFKRSGADFAIWKASKQGEPSWPSPWGEGRPGWHIECSVMASDVLGRQFDIHSGGIDLAFPHHDNELVQAEAHWCSSGKGSDSQQWVNYFLHMGHLSISGSKMSKSLKNFTTIRDALGREGWTPRGLRIVFLLGGWKDGIEITGDVIKASMAWEERVNNFFIKVRDLQRRNLGASTNGSTNGSATASDLGKNLETANTKFHEAMCDSFDTPSGMRIISELIAAYNSEKRVPLSTTVAIAQWITDIVHMFGLDAEKPKAGQLGWSGIEIPEKAKPFVYPLASLRDKVRDGAIAGSVDLKSLGRLEEKDTTYSSNQPYANAQANFQRKIVELHNRDASPKEYLAACDHLRDTVLWELGIYLEDREGDAALVRPLSATLKRDRDERESAKAAKDAAKAAAKEKAEAAEKEKLEQGRLSHLEMYKTDEFSAWDSDGMPTADADGNEIAKSRAKKLRKDWDRQKKLHEAYLKLSN